VTAVIALAADHLPGYTGFDQPDGAYGIVHVLGVTHVEPTEAERAALDKNWGERIVNADQTSFVQSLRDRFGARVLRADLSAPAAKKPAQ